MRILLNVSLEKTYAGMELLKRPGHLHSSTLPSSMCFKNTKSSSDERGTLICFKQKRFWTAQFWVKVRLAQGALPRGACEGNMQAAFLLVVPVVFILVFSTPLD